MSEEHSEEHGAHGDRHYVKIWAILLVLLIVSIIGPELEIRVVTLITAFGIAVVKAYMVAKHFMHINVEQRFIPYMMATVLIFMLLFFAGVAPDVMKDEGTQWEKPAWKAEAASAAVDQGDDHGDGHH
ncbi:MAG: cytochrome C oxidase subunit IV family protein [Proteobacteria bacterium]|nr:cytochrome C oxidase subunit IV family protein [Pseudomonadota bacterium]